MLNPEGVFPPGSYSDLRKRILKRLDSAKIGDQILAVAQNAYERALAVDNLVLSRVERQRLMQDVLRSVLAEASSQLDEDKTSG